ncbi:MTH1187 family thiamine-binding protein [Methanocaldococcus infernus]|uniref:Thiamine-binding protein domain-containing protein n=1 Tax=Methanocaldococcus infernus (strain DSM 11812 / JCM 15783 / ME) TaxID=573063 RepID=D5VQM0_METIM|nr:MTH1187 family thiamine-binding protein [Methanocaldococcus infernus]ADG12873.1 protein of unknown function DUF77 [Methanocaldococcus infernus ME]
MKVVAEISIIPMGKGPSVSKYVKKAIEVLKKYNLKVVPNAMGTVVEGELDEVIKAYKEAHLKVLEDVDRVVSQLKIDHRKDKENSIERKLKAIEVE